MKRYYFIIICIFCLLLFGTACQPNKAETDDRTSEAITTDVTIATETMRDTAMPTTSEHRSSQFTEDVTSDTSKSAATMTQRTQTSTKNTRANKSSAGLFPSREFTLREEIPPEMLPEIAGNKALLLGVLPYEDDEANRVARMLCRAGVPELRKVDEVRKNEYGGYFMRLLDVNNVVYTISISERRYLSMAMKIAEDGEKILIYSD